MACPFAEDLSMLVCGLRLTWIETYLIRYRDEVEPNLRCIWCSFALKLSCSQLVPGHVSRADEIWIELKAGDIFPRMGNVGRCPAPVSLCYRSHHESKACPKPAQNQNQNIIFSGEQWRRLEARGGKFLPLDLHAPTWTTRSVDLGGWGRMKVNCNEAKMDQMWTQHMQKSAISW